MQRDEDDTQPAVLERVSFRELIDGAMSSVVYLLHYVRLYFVVLLVLLLFAGMTYAVITPAYTAVALFGPPNPSPSTSLLTSMGTGGITGGAARRLLGGAQSISGDPFQELQQLLQTPRLTVELAKKDHFLQRIFHEKWDSKSGRWVQSGAIFNFISSIKRALNRPTTDHPDVLQLKQYLLTNLSIGQSEALASSPIDSISSSGTGYFTVSLTFDDRVEAERLLNDYLNRADTIIRKEQLSDVDARIQYINDQLAEVTQADQKNALIQVLQAQQQLKVMLVADKRYSFVMISPPYASSEPTKPPKPGAAIVICLLLSVFLWIVLVMLGRRYENLERYISHFKKRNVV